MPLVHLRLADSLVSVTVFSASSRRSVQTNTAVSQRISSLLHYCVARACEAVPHPTTGDTPLPAINRLQQKRITEAGPYRRLCRLTGHGLGLGLGLLLERHLVEQAGCTHSHTPFSDHASNVPSYHRRHDSTIHRSAAAGAAP